MSETIRINEHGFIPDRFSLITGLPDVGLVGVLATSHIVSSLKMSEVASIESELFPPITVLHDGIPKSPVRVYAQESIVAIISETVIPASLIHPLSETIVSWASKKKADLVLSIGGMAVQNRQDIDAPKVFAAVSDKSLLKKLNDSAELLGEGYIVGAYALILRKCVLLGLPAITLLTQSFYNYPDPEAAAAALRAVNKILKLNIDPSELLQKGEEIRLRSKDIMKRTQSEMARMDKSHEYEVPPLYG